MAGQVEHEDGYLRRTDLERRLRLSRNTVSRKLHRGEFPGAFQVNGRGDWRIPPSGLREYIEQRQRQATASLT